MTSLIDSFRHLVTLERRRFAMTAAHNHRDIPVVADGHDETAGATPRPGSPHRKAPRSRVGGLWVAAVVFALVLLVLLIFILQNGQRSEVSFFGAHGELPMGVALLLAAVFGVLLVALPGTARILQLRLRSRRAKPAPEPLTRPIPPPEQDWGQPGDNVT